MKFRVVPHPRATFQAFTEIEAWQEAPEWVREIYKISNPGSFSNDPGPRDRYIIKEEFDRSSALANETSGMIAVLMNSL